ncbi:hypothetical protein DO97_01495 [Neosynechococcus sphagnicola sy1]|uniref:Uncharacterized protein n=1 Tax=Neosynechococcus sphagnicola sy1 TaxID=1497020 RepID=A0A098TMV4_9CYAN|nr:hypothetical protein DO97_01495 [Neosynechococcus sphagnicola sy1]
MIRHPQRHRLQAWLKAAAIGTLIHYPLPVHAQPAYQGRVLIGAGGLEHTEQACREVLSLPMYPQLPLEQAEFVGDRIVDWYEQQAENR